MSKNEDVYISGLENFKFKTDDKIIDYISLMGNNMVPYAFIVGEKFTFFLYNLYKNIENDKTEEKTLLNTIDGCLDSYDYHVEKCGIDAFKIIRAHPNTYLLACRIEDEDDDLDEEDEENEDLIETIYTNWNDGMVKIFNQKCVICLGRHSVYAFGQCGHQCICEQCYQNRGDINKLKCVVCKTWKYENV